MLIDALKVARFFATVKHAGQTYSGLPYTHHLAAVEEVVRRFRHSIINETAPARPGGIGVEALWLQARIDVFDAVEVASWLHDSVEDTGTKVKEIAEMFGERVAELVEAVTKVPAENRRASALLTYPKTRSVPGATALKLADRIANVEHGGRLVDMYRREHEDFRRALYVPGEYEAMWAHLDGLLGAAGARP